MYIACVVSMGLLTMVRAGQIIVTDIEECIEALHENLAANLPHSCQLTSLGCQAAQPPAGRVGDCHASRRGELDGWDVPQSVIEVAAQDLATLSKPSATTKEPPGSHPRDSSDGYSVLNGHANGSATDRAGLGEAVQSNGAISVGSDLEVTQAETAQQRGSCQCISTSAVHHHDPQDREQQHVETPTGTAMLCDVVVHILDWRDDPSFLQPPFSVLLVADVVRSTSMVLAWSLYVELMAPNLVVSPVPLDLLAGFFRG